MSCYIPLRTLSCSGSHLSPNRGEGGLGSRVLRLKRSSPTEVRKSRQPDSRAAAGRTFCPGRIEHDPGGTRSHTNKTAWPEEAAESSNMVVLFLLLGNKLSDIYQLKTTCVMISQRPWVWSLWKVGLACHLQIQPGAEFPRQSLLSRQHFSNNLSL